MPVPDLATTQELAELCAVSVRTARRWKARGTMPTALGRWVSLAVTGDLVADIPYRETRAGPHDRTH